MKKRHSLFFIKDIQESLKKIFKYTENIDYDEFITNSLIIDAVERNFEIIGEAVKNISEEIKQKNPHIPFKLIAGMRDKLAHDYFGTDYSIIWQSIKYDLPQFEKDIISLIEQLDRK